MATGLFSLGLRALFVYVFYAYGPSLVFVLIRAILTVSPHDMLSFAVLNIA